MALVMHYHPQRDCYSDFYHHVLILPVFELYVCGIIQHTLLCV